MERRGIRRSSDRSSRFSTTPSSEGTSARSSAAPAAASPVLRKSGRSASRSSKREWMHNCGTVATIEVTAYTRHTYDLLLQSTPAPSTGFATRILNGGVLWNEGIEIAAGVTPIHQKNLNWVFRTTFTSLKNRVQELPIPDVCQPNATVCGFRPANAGFGLAYGEFFIQKDKPITQIIGTDTVPGSCTPTPDNCSFITRYFGQTNPKFRMSFSNEVTYKRLTLSMLF